MAQLFCSLFCSALFVFYMLLTLTIGRYLCHREQQPKLFKMSLAALPRIHEAD